MSLFTIIVDFTVEKSAMATFTECILINARTSLAEEEGCMRFDVLVTDPPDGRILLYEIYRDRSAFDIHSTSSHYFAFVEATEGMVLNKTVTICERLNPQSELMA